MKVRDAAAVLEISVSTVYALIASGKLRCYRVGNGRGAIRITDQQIGDFLRTAEVTGAIPPPSPRPRLKHLRL